MIAADIPNRDKKAAIRNFVRQLQFDPKTDELFIWFWPDPISPGGPKSKIALTMQKKKNKSSLMTSNGAGDRTHPEVIMIPLELERRNRSRKRVF